MKPDRKLLDTYSERSWVPEQDDITRRNVLYGWRAQEEKTYWRERDPKAEPKEKVASP